MGKRVQNAVGNGDTQDKHGGDHDRDGGAQRWMRPWRMSKTCELRGLSKRGDLPLLLHDPPRKLLHFPLCVLLFPPRPLQRSIPHRRRHDVVQCLCKEVVDRPSIRNKWTCPPYSWVDVGFFFKSRMRECENRGRGNTPFAGGHCSRARGSRGETAWGNHLFEVDVCPLEEASHEVLAVEGPVAYSSHRQQTLQLYLRVPNALLRAVLPAHHQV